MFNRSLLARRRAGWSAVVMVCITAAAMTWADRAQADTLKIVVGFSAGGSADQWARIIADGLAKETGTVVVVLNQPGAGGNIAAEAVSRSRPGDNMLFMTGASQHGAGAAMNSGARFDPERDFTLVAPFAESLNVVVVRAESPYETLRGLLDAAARKEQGLTYGSPGVGTSPHLAGELLKYRTGANLVHVPYKGAANALSDLMGGHLDMMVATLTVVREQVLAGKLRALAVLGPQRAETLPNVPTAREAGVPNVEMRVWGGLVGPAAMPAASADELNRQIGKVLEDPVAAGRLAATGSQRFWLDRPAFRSFVRDELTAWRKFARDAGIADATGAAK